MLDELIAALRHPDAVLRARPRHHAASRRIERGAPVDLVFQSIAGTEAANAQLRRRPAAARRGAATAALVAEARHASATTSCTSRPARARACRPTRTTASTSRRSRRAPTPWPARFEPLLVNTVVGFIGPEYLYDGKQIIRAGLEDHFCGKLLGLPMGCDVCYTNHAEADQDDMDNLLTLLGVGRLQLLHGRARRRRRHAQLPVDVVPRRALPAAACSACGRRRSSRRGSPGWASWMTEAVCAHASSLPALPGCSRPEPARERRSMDGDP